jgi:hypothetical protein
MSAPKNTENLNLVIINSHGIFFERDYDGDGEFEFCELHNPWETNGEQATEPWRPFDCKLIHTTSMIIIGGSMGLFAVKL